LIAKVRFRPVSQWCHSPVRGGNWDVLAGLEVEIDTGTLRAGVQTSDSCVCLGNAWMVTEKSLQQMAQWIGNSHGGVYVCEHMVEVD
jgi:hypothetical protein